MLHFDLWYRGENLLRDSGTFQYHCDPPWNHHFQSTAAHNTIELDGTNQMEKGPRFLWFRWTKSRLLYREQLAEDVEYWEGEHRGYSRRFHPITHRRALVRVDDNWLIVDDILGHGIHTATLRWHLMDVPWEIANCDTFQASTQEVTIRLLAPETPDTKLLRGTTKPCEGWESLYYGERLPIPVIRCTASSELPLRFVTAIEIQGICWEWSSKNQEFECNGRHVRLNPIASDQVIDLLS